MAVAKKYTCKSDSLIPACWLWYNSSVGNAQSAGHGPCIGQPANDGGLGLFPLLSLPPRLGSAVFFKGGDYKSIRQMAF